MQFLHKTLQEMCGASHWVHLIEKDMEKFDYYLHQIKSDNVFEMEYLLRFACGLSVQAAKHILPHVVQIMTEHDQLTDWYGELRDIFSNACQILPLYLLHEAETNNSDKTESAPVACTFKTFAEKCMHWYGLEFL